MSFLLETKCVSCTKYRKDGDFIEHIHTGDCLHRHHPGCPVGRLSVEKRQYLSDWVTKELKTGKEHAKKMELRPAVRKHY